MYINFFFLNVHNSILFMLSFSKKNYIILYIQYTQFFNSVLSIYTILYIQCIQFFKKNVHIFSILLPSLYTIFQRIYTILYMYTIQYFQSTKFFNFVYYMYIIFFKCIQLCIFNVHNFLMCTSSFTN